MKEMILIDKLITLIKPIVLELGYEFYYLELAEEDGENYLRIYIDNEAGIALEDCEKVSRRISELLDEEDPIDYSYYLEVSSPGVFRTLFTNEHLNKYIGFTVTINLKKLYKGKKKLTGKLLGFNDSNVEINFDEENIFIEREKIDYINLEGEL